MSSGATNPALAPASIDILLGFVNQGSPLVLNQSTYQTLILASILKFLNTEPVYSMTHPVEKSVKDPAQENNVLTGSSRGAYFPDNMQYHVL